MSKKLAVLAKLETFVSVRDSGVLTDEALSTAVNKAIEEKSIRALPVSAYTDVPENIVEFAKEFNLVKEPGASNGRGSRGSGATSNDKLVRAQFPDAEAFLASVDEFKKRDFTVTDEQGDQRLVVFMPYWRTIKPSDETQSQDANTSAESEVTV